MRRTVTVNDPTALGSPAELVDAITARQLAATTTHRQRPDDTLVRMLDVEVGRRREAA